MESGQHSGYKLPLEQTFAQLLGLGPSGRVMRTEYEVARNSAVIGLAETAALGAEQTAGCGQPGTYYDRGDPMHHWNAGKTGSKGSSQMHASPASHHEAMSISQLDQPISQRIGIPRLFVIFHARLRLDVAS